MRLSVASTTFGLCVLLVACGSGSDSGGGASSRAGASDLDDAVGGSGSGANGGATGSGATSGSNGGVQTGGPPCAATMGSAVEDVEGFQVLFSSENVSFYGGWIVTPEGIFWGQSASVVRLPLEGGTPTTLVAEGQYSVLGTRGAELLLKDRSADETTGSQRVFAVPWDGTGATPTERFAIGANESLVAMDEEYAYLYDETAAHIEKAALLDGSRSLVAEGLSAVGAVELYGDYLYFEPDSMHVARVLKAGGGAVEDYLYEFDLWHYNLSAETILVGTWQGLMSAPLATPGELQPILSILDGFMDWATIYDGRIVYMNWDGAVGWVSLDGTSCEGVYAGNSFADVIFNEGWIYVEDGIGFETRIARFPMPQ